MAPKGFNLCNQYVMFHGKTYRENLFGTMDNGYLSTDQHLFRQFLFLTELLFRFRHLLLHLRFADLWPADLRSSANSEGASTDLLSSARISSPKINVINLNYVFCLYYVSIKAEFNIYLISNIKNSNTYFLIYFILQLISYKRFLGCTLIPWRLSIPSAHQVAEGTFFMKSPVHEFGALYCKKSHSFVPK